MDKTKHNLFFCVFIRCQTMVGTDVTREVAWWLAKMKFFHHRPGYRILIDSNEIAFLRKNIDTAV